jgi:hypothetical protein
LACKGSQPATTISPPVVAACSVPSALQPSESGLPERSVLNLSMSSHTSTLVPPSLPRADLASPLVVALPSAPLEPPAVSRDSLSADSRDSSVFGTADASASPQPLAPVATTDNRPGLPLLRSPRVCLESGALAVRSGASRLVAPLAAYQRTPAWTARPLLLHSVLPSVPHLGLHLEKGLLGDQSRQPAPPGDRGGIAPCEALALVRSTQAACFDPGGIPTGASSSPHRMAFLFLQLSLLTLLPSSSAP